MLVVIAAASLFALPSDQPSAQPIGIGGCRSLEQLGSTQLHDFNDPSSSWNINLVESNHFNQDVESLRKGQTGTVPADLDFVLRAIPNHYRALTAMGRWQLRNKTPRDQSARVEPAECYFSRAIQFRPEDPTLHVVYGVYLHQAKRLADAEREYSRAEELGGRSAELYYNFGLLLVETGELSRAKAYAEKAYALGYPLPGLRNKLRKASEQ